MGPNEKILRKAYADYAKGDVDSVIPMFADDVVMKSVGAPNRLDHSGEWHGLEGVRGFLAAIAANWAFQKIEMLEMIAQSDTRFVVRSAVTGMSRQTGGRMASVERVDFVTMKNGKCMSYLEIFDTSPLERASRL
jgi:ketosteroid isomerase-like protein